MADTKRKFKKFVVTGIFLTSFAFAVHGNTQESLNNEFLVASLANEGYKTDVLMQHGEMFDMDNFSVRSILRVSDLEGAYKALNPETDAKEYQIEDTKTGKRTEIKKLDGHLSKGSRKDLKKSMEAVGIYSYYKDPIKKIYKPYDLEKIPLGLTAQFGFFKDKSGSIYDLASGNTVNGKYYLSLVSCPEGLEASKSITVSSLAQKDKKSPSRTTDLL